MSHTITYHEKLHAVEVAFQGELAWNEVQKVASEAAQALSDHDCHLLFADFREAELRLSTLELYNLPNAISDIVAASGLRIHAIKRAALIGPTDVRDFEFFEDVTANRGQNMKLFRDIDEARRWLSD